MFGNNVAAAGNSSSNENEMQKLANTLAFALRHDPDLNIAGRGSTDGDWKTS